MTIAFPYILIYFNKKVADASRTSYLQFKLYNKNKVRHTMKQSRTINDV